jgi:hypothetical protein
MKIYISGQISGLPERTYRTKFANAKIELQSRYPGAEIICPVHDIDHSKHEDKWEEYMKIDVIELMKCDAIAVMPDFINSRGAIIELGLAMDLGYKVIEV